MRRQNDRDAAKIDCRVPLLRAAISPLKTMRAMSDAGKGLRELRRQGRRQLARRSGRRDRARYRSRVTWSFAFLAFVQDRRQARRSIGRQRQQRRRQHQAFAHVHNGVAVGGVKADATTCPFSLPNLNTARRRE